MTREELTQTFLDSTSKHYILQLPTSYGKSRMALQKIDQWYTKDCNILIVIPFLVLKTNWKDEIEKWGYNKMLDNITFTTYISLPKHCGKKWDYVIMDEVHHTSLRCREAMAALKPKHLIGLSATIKRDILDFYKSAYNPKIIRVAIKDAIESNVLPDPKILLIPLKLDNRINNHVIEKNFKKNSSAAPINIVYSDSRKYRNYKGPLRILCTQQQYYDDLSGLIEWYKQKGMTNPILKKQWLHKAGERLKWLASQKEAAIKYLLKELKDFRILTFCQSIEQSETLGCPCVNSKIGTKNLERFNAGKVKHISAIAMLDEGINPVDCKIGLFQMINSSQRIIVQRGGRILRHKKPIFIFPYYIDTREQEIVSTIIKDYNPELITVMQPSEVEVNLKKFIKNA